MYFAFIVRNMSSSRVFWFHLKRLAVSRFGVLLPDCVLFEAQKEVGSLSSAASIGHASEADFCLEQVCRRGAGSLIWKSLI